MRRLVAIRVRSVVAVALPLAGAIYLAAEARQAVIRRYCETPSLQPVNAQLDSRSGDRAIGPSGDLLIVTKTAVSGDVSTAIDLQLAKLSQSDELVAEQQAAQMPALKSPEKPTKDAHTRRIVVSIPDRRLALLEDGKLVKVFPVAVGADETPSPDGEFTIINHAVDPTYRHADRQISPGKDNPLGTRWMGLSLKGYGIHGTNVQSSVGKAASHGCFRMKKKDVEELYKRVQVGDAVSIRGERDELTVSLFTTGTNASPATAANKAETQIASVATPSATADEDR
jgi:lipoprotein-anchoring transpeptidase ErfK/SrfK